MKKTIEQLIRDNFYQNGVALTGRDFNQAYRDLMVDYLSGDVQIIEDDGSINKAFPTKQDKVATNFTRYRERFDDLMDDYVKDHPDCEFKDQIKDIARGKNRHLIHFDIDEKILIQPSAYSFYEKTVVKMQKAIKSQDIIDMPDAENVRLLKDAAKDIKSIKPSIFTWLFNRRSYNDRMSQYNHLKELFLSGIKSKFYPEFIQKNFGSPAKICGLDLQNARSTDYVLKEIRDEYTNVVEKSQDKTYEYQHRPEIKNEIVMNNDPVQMPVEQTETIPQPYVSQDEFLEVEEKNTEQEKEVPEASEGMTEKDIDPLLNK